MLWVSLFSRCVVFCCPIHDSCPREHVADHTTSAVLLLDWSYLILDQIVLETWRGSLRILLVMWLCCTPCLCGGEVTQLQSEAEVPKQSSSESPAFRPLTLPADLAPSSAEIISTLNEYAIRLLQVNSVDPPLFVCVSDWEMLRVWPLSLCYVIISTNVWLYGIKYKYINIWMCNNVEFFFFFFKMCNILCNNVSATTAI